MSARAPWDRAIIAGTKTVEGRVASWRRRGKWVDNKKVVALNSPKKWFQYWTADSWLVLEVEEYATGPTFGGGWSIHGAALVPPDIGAARLGRAVASEADVDELYQQFYPRDPLFDPETGESNIVAAFISVRVVAVVWDKLPATASPRRPDVQFADDGLTPEHSTILMALPACIDKKHSGVAQDITRPAVGNALVAAASLERCRFVWISLNCNTYSVLHYLPDARGQPGKPYRDTDNVLGYRRSDGTLPPAVAESNLTTRVAVEVAMACASHDGAVGAETPQKRRGGPPDGMPGCEKHVHNFDHPSWQLFIEASPCSG